MTIYPYKENKLHIAQKMVKILACITAVLVVVALGLMGAAAWMQHTSGSLGRMQTQVKSVKKTSDNMESLIVVAQTALNASSGDVRSSVSAEKLEDAANLATKEKVELESEKDELTVTLNDIGTPMDREAGNNAISLANKELILIGRFEAANKYTLPYVKMSVELSSALDKLVKADSADREVTTQLLAENIDDATKSIETAGKAKSLALEAKAQFEAAKQTNDESEVRLLDNSKIEEYVTFSQLVADAQDAAVGTANAYIARNKDELITQNDAYNRIREKANTISEKWEKEITVLLDDAFDEFRADDVEGFNQDLKERDSLFNTVTNYLKGKE